MTVLIHNAAQNSSDNLSASCYPPDKHHSDCWLLDWAGWARFDVPPNTL